MGCHCPGLPNTMAQSILPAHISPGPRFSSSIARHPSQCQPPAANRLASTTTETTFLRQTHQFLPGHPQQNQVYNTAFHQHILPVHLGYQSTSIASPCSPVQGDGFHYVFGQPDHPCVLNQQVPVSCTNPSNELSFRENNNHGSSSFARVYGHSPYTQGGMSRHSHSHPFPKSLPTESAAPRMDRGHGNSFSQSSLESRESGNLKTSRSPSLEMVMEDPSSPTRHREKRPRTKKESDKQKEDSRLLREFGGACVWCYRSKKKCGPSDPCPSCTSNKRKCIREFSQLRLHVPSNETDASNDRMNARISGIFDCLKGQMQGTAACKRIVVKFRGLDSEEVWVTNMSQLLMDDESGMSAVTNELIWKSLKSIPAPNLPNVETRVFSQPLMVSVLAMSRLLTGILAFAHTRIYLSPADIDAGRMAMVYMLAALRQTLCQESEEFCSALSAAMRRKEAYEPCTSETSKSASTTWLNPVWVATGLYCRVLDKVLEFHAASLNPGIFDEMAPRLREVRSSVWSILKNVPVGHAVSKASVKESFDSYIPALSTMQSVDVAFWVDRESFPPPDPFSGTYYEMQPFLDPNFNVETFLPSRVPLTLSSETSMDWSQDDTFSDLIFSDLIDLSDADCLAVAQ